MLDETTDFEPQGKPIAKVGFSLLSSAAAVCLERGQADGDPAPEFAFTIYADGEVVYRQTFDPLESLVGRLGLGRLAQR